MDEQMKIDGEQVRKLREARAWSQEHLAAAAGLSARTIQRVESEGAAAPETRLAIASAFGVAATSLAPPIAMVTFQAADPTKAPRQAKRRVLANSVLWAATIIAAAAMGSSSLLCTILLPAMAVGSMWLVQAPRPGRCAGKPEGWRFRGH
jgi:transcriptional regulator with XRE-family HTH domain